MQQLRNRAWRAKAPAGAVMCSYKGGDGRGSSRPGQRNRGNIKININDRSITEYALPAAGLLAISLIAGPLLGSLVFGALGLGVAVTFAATALTLSWALLPLLMLGGGGLMLAGGLFAGVTAGGLLIFNLLKFGALGGALWLGAKFAQSIFDDGEPRSSSSSTSSSSRARREAFDEDGTIDVDASTVDSWTDEELREQRRKEEELREFDDLLRRREAFKNKDGRGL